MNQPSNSIPTLQQEGRAQLQAAGIESAALDARLLLEHALGLSREAMLLKSADFLVEPRGQSLYKECVERRAKSEPVAKIIGRKEFWKHSFQTSASTLDPRPDSETLIEAVLRAKPTQEAPLRMLDLGTGTGCLILSLLHEYQNAAGVAVEQSEEALSVAQKNARAMELSERVEFCQSHWFENVTKEPPFDVLISNPPYIAESERETLPKDVRDYDPEAALFSGENGLADYREIISSAGEYVAQGGILALEIGQGQGTAIGQMSEALGWEIKHRAQDLAGIERVLVLTRTEQIESR